MGKLKIILPAVLSIVVGSLIFYFNGYKDSGLIKTTFYVLVLGGWLTLLITIAGKAMLDASPKGRTFFAITSLVFMGAGAGSIFLTIDLSEKRVARILSTGDTQSTTALVTKLEDRRIKNNTKHYAIINYQAADQAIEQAIFDYKHAYTVGQTVEIKYSVEYPEMFKLADTIAKDY